LGNFVVQYSSQHVTKKRLAVKKDENAMVPVIQQFNPHTFNFNKINPEEVIADVRMYELGPLSWLWKTKKSRLRDVTARVMINISPLAPAHCVVAVRPKNCLPQILTRDSLELGLAMLKDSRRSDIKVLFNSLGAYASQNHLHMHIVYLKGLGFPEDRLALEHAASEESSTSSSTSSSSTTTGENGEEKKRNLRLSSSLIRVDRYPVRSFRFSEISHNGNRDHDGDSVGASGDDHCSQDGSGYFALASRVHSFVRKLQEQNIAHNVLMAKSADDGNLCDVYVIPRQNQCKNNTVVLGEPLKFAVVEVCGLVLARSDEQMDNLTETHIRTEMARNVCLPPDDLERVTAFAVRKKKR